MRARLGRALAVLVGLCCLSAEAQTQPTIHWQTNLDTAKRLAAQSNKLVLVHFWAPYCPACRRMDQEVFPQPSVAAAIEANYVAIKLNAEYFTQTTQQYDVTRLPTDVIINPQGQLVQKSEGFLRAPDYISQLNQVAASARPAAPPMYAQVPAPQVRPPESPANPATPANQGNRADLVPGQTARQPASGVPLSDNRYADYFRQQGGAETAPTGIPAIPSPTGTGVPSPSPTGTGVPGMATNDPFRRYQTAPSPSSPPYTSEGRPQATQPALTQAAPTQPAQTQPAQTQPPASPAGIAVAQGGLSNSPTATNQPGATSRPGFAAVGVSAQQPPAGNPPLGLDGYCPVQLVEKQRWTPGDVRWGVIHRGRTYLFSGADEQQRFLANPDYFAPVMAGLDVVLAVEQHQTVPGSRAHGGFYANRIYLFANEESLGKFTRDPERYINAALQALRPTGYTPYR